MSNLADDSVLYPVLSDDEVATLRRYGALLRTTARQVLCSPSDDSYDMVVVLSGGLEVADDSHGRNLLFAQPGPGQFAGELNLLTGQRPFVTIRVTAAAVYGASEGLEVAVLEAAAPGGQAGSTSRIENYLGFPQGISGAELTTRATIQAQKFGALLASPCRVDRLAVTGKQFSVLLADGTTLSARTVVAATGAVYRRLPLAGWRHLEGAGIYYAATDLEAGSCAGSPVIVLGGGNSAGQAALYLARRCPRVTIVSRNDSFAASMSQYLINRVAANPRIDVAKSTIIQAVDGGEHLESVILRNTATGSTERLGAGGCSASSARCPPAADYLRMSRATTTDSC